MIYPNKNIYKSIIEIQKQGIPSVLVTVIDTLHSTPRETGAKMIVKKNGEIINTIGGGIVEKMVIEESLKIINTQKPKIIKYDLEGNSKGKTTGMICGGMMKFFIEPININPYLYIFGAGHIGKAMYQLGLMNNFNITIIDNRNESINDTFFKEASVKLIKDYKASCKEISFLNPAYIIIATHTHKSDEIVLNNLLRLKISYNYIGMVASKRKITEIKKRLIEDKISEEKINTVHSPAGVPINSNTPEEIAISIIAEMIKIKNSTIK